MAELQQPRARFFTESVKFVYIPVLADILGPFYDRKVSPFELISGCFRISGKGQRLRPKQTPKVVLDASVFSKFSESNHEL